MSTHNLEMYQTLYPDAEVIKWHQIYRGKKFHKVRPEMLREGGEALTSICRVKGDTAESEKLLRIVIFDRDYVITKLAVDNKLIATNLKPTEFTQLMGFVYDKIQGD
jgi:hypothetical protein